MNTGNITLQQAWRMNRIGGQLVAAATRRSPERREEMLATAARLYALVGDYLQNTESQ